MNYRYRPKYWEGSAEHRYIDEYFESLITVMVCLKLIQHVPDSFAILAGYSRKELYDRLIKYAPQ